MKNVGVGLIVMGVVLTIIAGYDFFTLDMWEEPKYFWMFFVALPLIFIGLVLNGQRIQKAMFEQQKDTLRETMKVMGEGLNEGLSRKDKFCPNCGKSVSSEDKFCSECGNSLNNER
jgi:ribosomal protein S27AE